MQHNQNKKTPLSKNYLIKNASITSLCRGLGIVSGMILDALILAYFGLSKETDAFFAALAIPFLITTTLEIQVPKVLVPVFTRSLKEDGEEATWHLLRNFITVCLVLLSAASLLGTLFAGVLMPIQVPGLKTEVARLCVSLGRVLSWLVLIRGIAAILQSILYVYHKYLVPSSIKSVSNIVTILALILLHDHFGIGAVALGFLLGGTIQLIMLISALASQGFRYGFVCKFKDPRLHRIFKLLVYPLMGHSLTEARALLENFLASFLPTGSLSVLRYASRIVQALSGVLVGSIVTATLPLISHYTAVKGFDEMKQAILKGIKLLLYTALPLGVWLIFTSKPMLILFFERGNFSRADAALTSTIIALMVPYILLSRVVGITQTPFYGTMDTRTPLFGGVISFITNAVVALLLLGIIGIYAFPIASSTASLVTAIFMSVALHMRFGALGWQELKGFVLRLCGTTVLTLFSFMLGLTINDHLDAENMIGKLIVFVIPTAIGTATFFTSSFLFGVIRWDHVYALRGRIRISSV